MPRRLPIALVLVSVALASLAACKKAPAPPPDRNFDERQACTVDDDCAAVEIGCCDHCNGGTAVGVDRDDAADVVREYHAAYHCGGPDNAGGVCTLMACPKAEPICRNQRCGVSIGGDEQMTPLPRL